MEELFAFLKEKGLEVRNPLIYEQACTHSSYANEASGSRSALQDNERLEFVGDAVLQLWSAETLFNLEPPLREGKMTTLRAQVVCETTLARVNEELGWYKSLRLGVGEERSGGRKRKSLMADQFEAVLGAVYTDLGYFAAFELLDAILLPVVYEKRKEDGLDYKTRLQEYVQTDRRSVIQYRLLEEEGPSNHPLFTIGVYLDGICMGTGQASSKKKAEQKAAEEAFHKLAKNI